MWLHEHPYEPFIPRHATKLILGTLPPPRFSFGQLLETDVDFPYGSAKGMLWKILDHIFDLHLSFQNNLKAIEQRRIFLEKNAIGICDIVESCHRKKIDASDLGMQSVNLRDLLHYLEKYAKVDTLIFMGGNSKNGPEYFFRKILSAEKIKLQLIDEDLPRKHSFIYQNKKYFTYSLTAPSGSANRAIGSLNSYKTKKKADPKYTTFDFRIEQYSKVFKSKSVESKL